MIVKALFGTIEEGDEAMGSLVETAIFSQWLHIDNRLHYARWSDGEVDIVNTSKCHVKDGVKISTRKFNLKTLNKFSVTSVYVMLKTKEILHPLYLLNL
jgi:predicted AAA+ superfamily ATPase